MLIQTSIEMIEGERPLIRLQGIEVFDDGSGAYGLLSLNSGHFSCHGYPFYFDNLKSFCRGLLRLYTELKGRARLAHTYEHDFIEFEIDKLGHVMVHGEIGDSGGAEEQKMFFAFTVDQSYLPPLISSAKSVLEEMDRTR